MKVVIALAALLTVAAAQQQKACGALADIVFVVDASGSVQAPNFETTKKFMVETAKKFTISPKDVLIGVVKYDSNTYPEFPLNRHTNEAALVRAINGIKYTGGGTATGKAINVMLGEFSAAKGDRSNAPNIGIVVTDGNSGDAVKAAADAAKKRGITMFAIGVGPNINTQQLNDIASKKEYVLRATNFADLQRIQGILATRFCQVATKPPTPKPTPKPTPRPTPPPTTLQQCGKADMVFVVDASGSVGSGNFGTTKQFVTNVAQSFKIGPADVQIGLVKYDSNPVVEFKLNQHKTRGTLVPAIQKVPYTAGGTNTGKAMNTMLSLFTPANGRRSNVPAIGIVITDGNSSDDVKTVAAKAKAQGIIMFAIGVGNSLNQQQLKDISSGPGYVLNVKNFNDLAKIRQTLLTEACKVISNPPKPPTTTTTTTECRKQVADIVFALDSSGSIGVNNYNVLKNWVTSVAGTLNIGQNAIRVGVLRFSDKVTNSFHLNQYGSVAQVQNAIKTLPYDAAGTRTHEALQFMREQSFKGGNGARQGVPQVAIIVTDGQSAFPAATKSEADKLKKAGVTVFAIGVGSQVSQQELQGMASAPQNVLNVNNYQDLQRIGPSIRSFPCRASPPPVIDRTTVTPRPGCYDKRNDCKGFGNDVCTDYVPWAKEHCACFCGFCQCNTNQGPCVDLLSDCKDFGGKEICINPGYTLWVEKNCRKYCGRC